MGKPVWTLIPDIHRTGRWFLDRADTPWYSTMRLFRQVERNRWATPISQIAEALRQLVNSGGT